MISVAASFLLAAAQAVPSPPAPPPPPACTAARATRLTVAQINEAPQLHLGRCITVSGIGGRARIYDDVAGIYREGRGGTEGDRARIGLAGIAGPGGLPDDDPRPMTVTGILETCERLRAFARASGGPRRDPPAYCQFAFGPILAVAEHRFAGKGRVDRLVGEENRRRHGTLAFAPEGWEALPRLRAAAQEFRRAVAKGDRAALAALHGARGDPYSDPEILSYLLDRPDSPFAQLRRGGGRRIAVLLHTGAIRESIVRSGSEEIAFLCFCRTPDCDGLWPISAEDAENRYDRPYACTYHDPYSDRRFMTSIEHGWLPEPKASAFRR